MPRERQSGLRTHRRARVQSLGPLSRDMLTIKMPGADDRAKWDVNAMTGLTDSGWPRKTIIVVGGISVPIPDEKWGDYNDVLRLGMPAGTPGIAGCRQCISNECGSSQGIQHCLRIVRHIAECIEKASEAVRPEIADAPPSDSTSLCASVEPSPQGTSSQFRTLRLYQETLLGTLRDAIEAGCRRIVVQAPTGAGKTVIAATLIRPLVEADQRVIFTVPFLALIEQTVERFRAEGINDIGVIQADHPLTDPSARVQVASVQTLLRCQIPRADLVMIDECHRWFDFYGDWMMRPEWRETPFLGLSATPWTCGLGRHFSSLIVGTTIVELIEQGYLTPFRVFAPTSPDLSGVRTIAGDYHERDLSRVMGERHLIGDVVATWLRLAEQRPTLCFGVNRAHAKHLQERFEDAGVPAAYVDAETTMVEREAIRQAFHDGAIKAVCSVGTLTTGVDWDVRAIILARPTKSEILFVQMIGRGLRPAAGKTDLLILDHSSNHARLGFVSDIHHTTLDTGEPKAKQEPRKPLPSRCPKCFYLKRPQLWECPNCGYAPPRPVPLCVPGGLEQIVQPGLDDARRRFYQQLKYYAASRGFQSGWIAHKYRERFGSWPPPSFSTLSPIELSPSTRTWLREQARLFAISRRSAS
jgi:DNA repair protein RadD